MVLVWSSSIRARVTRRSREGRVGTAVRQPQNDIAKSLFRPSQCTQPVNNGLRQPN
jgi:hypothetical protein